MVDEEKLELMEKLEQAEEEMDQIKKQAQHNKAQLIDKEKVCFNAASAPPFALVCTRAHTHTHTHTHEHTGRQACTQTFDKKFLKNSMSFQGNF